MYLCHSKVFAIRTEAEPLIRVLWACYVYKALGRQRPYCDSAHQPLICQRLCAPLMQ